MAVLGGVLVGVSHVVDANAGAPANYQPRDAVLRRAPLRFYRSQHPRALVWFFGNDIGFWGPQQRLAAQLADGGYDVVGMDLRAWLAQRPHEPAAAREAAFRSGMADLQSRAARELGDTLLPVVLAGHSVGAEVALWQGAMAPPHGLAGVVAISPGTRGHLRVTTSDLAFGEPTEPGSFAVAQMVHEVPAGVRVAIVRGSSDRLRGADSLLVPARPGLHRVIVPLAGHSMRRLLIAGPLIAGAIDWTIDR
ncbi:MAG: serine aminopeptidase domain-containing protein [Gemmatimonadaceae bacterium]